VVELIAVLLVLRFAAIAQDTTSSDNGTAYSAQYSALNLLDRSNVARLDAAWRFSTGDP
jgi:glucose dehydrogenase